MKFNQKEYIKNYQKNNYKMYQFRVKKDNKELINKLDNMTNRNNYIVNMLNNDLFRSRSIYTLNEIKKIIKPILAQYGIYEIYLFGSYARGEANDESDVDIYCEDGNLDSLFTQAEMEIKLRESLKKDVDVVYMNSKMSDSFRKSIEKDLVKLC